MTDPYAHFVNAASAPARSAKAVTTHNTNPLADGATRGLYVGVSGDIACRLLGDDTDVLVKAAPVGILPLRVTHVRTTSTTATNLLALY
ncbi:hypothetical protein CJD35_01870 [Sphingobium xenophagum]|uniref:Uncharacterized protein n=1 Tax=Sphingobium xenophagum TaxID=121428 RepID=A0A249MQD5_SPHXE|nr:hypothetical protein [Sphingobium xenophagum]ASY43337.1 hypothetical protein CJD35_01870 [Sphingobium xenophagum]